jgi:hypothetical protein
MLLEAIVSILQGTISQARQATVVDRFYGFNQRAL